MKKNIKITVLTPILFVLILALMSCLTGLKVTVINQSDRPLKYLYVKYRGDQFFARHLEKDGTRDFYMKVKGESIVVVEYSNSIYNDYRCFIEVVFDQTYLGTLDIKIGNNGKTSYRFVDKKNNSEDSIIEGNCQCEQK
jgi:hypothetical protein